MFTPVILSYELEARLRLVEPLDQRDLLPDPVFRIVVYSEPQLAE
jgi:hypothetical protein